MALRVKDKSVVARGEARGWGVPYKGKSLGVPPSKVLVVMEDLRILIVAVATQGYTWNKIFHRTYTHTHTRTQMGTCRSR